jgi:hypothetical protein
MALDATDLIWPLLDNMGRLPFDELKLTPEYRRIAEVMAGGDTETPIRIHIRVLELACLSAYKGVAYEPPFVYFDDVNVLFNGLFYMYRFKNDKGVVIGRALEAIREHGRMKEVEEGVARVRV